MRRIQFPTRRQAIAHAVALAAIGGSTFIPATVQAVDTASFSAANAGNTKAITQWGDEIAEVNANNFRESLDTMGSSLTILNTYYEMGAALNADGTLSTAQQQAINNQIAIAALAGKKLLIEIGPSVGDTDPSYLNGGSQNVNVTQWANAMLATKAYWQANGYTVAWAAPFTEPDYWSGQGSPQQNAQIMQLLQANPSWTGTQLLGPSTLSSDNAQSWYNPLAGIANAGSSHVLGGSLTSYVNFMQSVQSGGGQVAAPEMHSLAEAIVSANSNAIQGMWWGPAYPARGTFSQVSSGKQIGYSVNYNTQTAAAIYRGQDGSTYAFAGGLERFGGADTYRFTTDRGAFFNGIGPIRSYSLQAGNDNDIAVTSNDFTSFGAYFSQGAMAKVDYGSGSIPALDGYRWEIQNVKTGQVLTVANSNTTNGATVNTAANTSGLNQMWNVVGTQDGYLELFNANSGLTLEDSNGSNNSGNQVWQYGTAVNNFQQWYLAPAGNGTFYIKNASSTLFLTANSTSTTQNTLFTGSNAGLQQWQFVPVNPTRTVKAGYAFNGNANDSTGSFNGSISGTASYTTGPKAGTQALVFNGSNTYVTLPSAITNSYNAVGVPAHNFSGITVDTWVKWNGGNAWQRIFDFGTGTNGYMFLTPSSGSGTLRFGITSAGNTEEEDVDADALPTGQWVNLAVTLGGRTAVIYLNGRPVAAGNILINPTFFNPTSSYIGKSQFSGDPLFNGSISQFNVYDYALTQTQVDDLLNNNLTWVGTLNGNVWDANSTSNFKLISNGTSSVFTQNDRVTFDGTGASSVVINSTVSPFSVTITASSNMTFSGSGTIAGNGTLTMSGAGTVTLATANTYNGDTSINSGTLCISADNNLGADASNLNLNGGALKTTSTNAMIFGHSILVSAAGGTLSIVGNGAATTGQADRIILNAANMLIGGGALTISGTGTLAGAAPNTTTAGAGALVLNGSNTFSGNITLQSGGLLEFANASALDPNATITLGNEGELTVSNGNTVPNAIKVAGGANSTLSFTNAAAVFSGHITLNANLTVALRNWYNYSSVQNGTLSGVLSGAGNLTINSGSGSNGTLTLSGANTFTGNITINSSTLNAANGVNAVHSTNGALGNPASAGRTVTVNAGSLLLFPVGNVLGSGGSPQANAPALTIIVNGGTLQTAAPAVGTIASGNTGQGDANIFGAVTLNGGSFIAGNGYNADYRAAILMKTITVGGSSPSTMSTNGTFTAGNGFMLGGATAGTNFVVFNVADATGNANPDLIVSSPLTDSAGSASNPANIGALTKIGAGTMQLSGNDTYQGGTNVAAGELIVANVNALGTGALYIYSGGVVQLQSGLGQAVVVPSVTFDGSPGAWAGVLDLTNNKLIVEAATDHATALATLQSQSHSVLTSSTLPANFGIAVIDNQALATPFTSFGGQHADQNSILVAPEILGDTNADGHVDATDLNTVLNNFGASTAAWTSGNFDGAPTIDLTDLAYVLNNFGLTNSAPSSSESATPSPEPTTAASLLIAAVVNLLRKRNPLRRTHQRGLSPSPVPLRNF